MFRGRWGIWAVALLFSVPRFDPGVLVYPFVRTSQPDHSRRIECQVKRTSAASMRTGQERYVSESFTGLRE